MNRLSISADRLTFLENGQPWIQRGCLDWPLYGRFLNGGEAYARSIFRDRRSVGANTIALAGMLAWPDLGFNPTHPHYWTSLSRFAQIADEESIRLQWVVLCDTRELMPDLNSQIAHWERFLTHLGAAYNCTFVVANQPGHDSQTITRADTRLFLKAFSHQLCSRDNPHESENPVLPPMDFSCYCSSRDPYKGYVEVGSSMWYVVHGWPKPEGNQTWDGTQQVSILFEPYRIEASPSNGWDDPGKARQLARSLAFEGTGGGNCYSRQGRNAEVFTGVTRDCYVEYLGNIPAV